MGKTVIRSRIDPAIKEEPFEVKAPNEVTLSAVRAAERGELERTSLKKITRDAKSSKQRGPRRT
jgi:antitoxin component of RelBE/YafQ-DinJ toxin-antitoxin module